MEPVSIVIVVSIGVSVLYGTAAPFIHKWLNPSYMPHDKSAETKFLKYITYVNWCKRNGVVMPKVEFPAYFENGLVGIKASEDIKHR